MAEFTDRDKATTSFTDRSLPSSDIRLVGDLSEDDWIVLLGFSPVFDTPIPQCGGRLFGDLAFNDTIDLRALIFTDKAMAETVFTDRDIE